jgi:hypothetical protein
VLGTFCLESTFGMRACEPVSSNTGWVDDCLRLAELIFIGPILLVVSRLDDGLAVIGGVVLVASLRSTCETFLPKSASDLTNGKDFFSPLLNCFWNSFSCWWTCLSKSAFRTSSLCGSSRIFNRTHESINASFKSNGFYRILAHILMDFMRLIALFQI